MSKDIRSFFTVISKKTNSATPRKPKKKVNPLVDSDDEVIESTPENTKTKSITIKKRTKTIQISSDSEEEPTTRKKSKLTTKIVPEAKLKPVNIDEFLNDKPIKQSKVNPKPKVEPIKDDIKKRPKKKTETDIHEDDEFDKTLQSLDDDLFAENLDVLDRTIDEALGVGNKKNEDEQNNRKNSPIKQKDTENRTKRQRTPSEGTTPKKMKFIHVDSGIDPDQDSFDKRRYSAMCYQKYKNREGPKLHGQKELPKGKPDCLKNVFFLKTGVLDSLESEEFQNLVMELGGRVVKAVSRKVNYVVYGEDPGPSKIEKARSFGIPEINEDEFFDLILVKSGMKPKYFIESNVSVESGISLGDSPKKIVIDSDEELEEKLKTKKSSLKTKKHSPSETKKNSPIELKKHSLTEKEKELNGDKKKIKTDSKLMQPKEEMESPLNRRGATQQQNKQTLKEEIKLKFNTEKPISNSDNCPKNTDQVDSSLAWTEKYKPRSTQNVIGQQGDSSNLTKLRKWLNNWYRNQLPQHRKGMVRPSPWAKNDDGAYFKAALLSGQPGVGKTTTATLVARELGFDIVEFNASDTRSKKLLQEEVAQLLQTTTIAGFVAGKPKTDKKRVLLMDEVDGMSGNEDRGGMQELINLIKNTSVPIICMCNDRNHQKMRSLVNYCFDLRFTKPRMEQIRGAMMTVCHREGVSISPNIVSEIILGTGCDIRQTLNHLTMYAAMNKNNTLEQVQIKCKESKKDSILGPWEVVRCVFTDSEQKNMSLADKARLFFYDYSMGPLFVQENYLGVTPNCEKKDVLKRVALAADAISKGDLIDSKIRGSNNWALLESQAMYSSVLPGYYMSGKICSRINFPGWLGKNSAANKRKRLLNEICCHTRKNISGNALAMKLDYLIPLRNAIIYPMLNQGSAGVAQSIQFMQDYSLMREDLNNLVDLCTWKNGINPFNKVDSKVKSAFTRTYNKMVQKVTPGTGLSKKKISNDDENDQILESDDEENDDVNADSLIKIKPITKDEATNSKKGAAPKKKAPAKGKEKTKKSK